MDAIVVTHNSAQDLRLGLLASAPVFAAFERVIVVDNASTDETVALAESRGLEVLARQVNDGFGAGVNAGAKLASGFAFAVLNPDISFETVRPVERALVHFEDPDVGIVAPALRLPTGLRQDSVRRVPSLANLLVRRLVRSQAQSGAIATDTVADVPWAVAACWFVERSWFDRLGGFDECYFLYFEDVDYCVRLAKLGGVVRFDPDAIVEHRHQGDSRKTPFGWANRQHVRSAIHFYRTHPEYLLGNPRYGR